MENSGTKTGKPFRKLALFDCGVYPPMDPIGRQWMHPTWADPKREPLFQHVVGIITRTLGD